MYERFISHFFLLYETDIDGLSLVFLLMWVEEATLMDSSSFNVLFVIMFITAFVPEGYAEDGCLIISILLICPDLRDDRISSFLISMPLSR